MRALRCIVTLSVLVLAGSVGCQPAAPPARPKAPPPPVAPRPGTPEAKELEEPAPPATGSPTPIMPTPEGSAPSVTTPKKQVDKPSASSAAQPSTAVATPAEVAAPRVRAAAPPRAPLSAEFVEQLRAAYDKARSTQGPEARRNALKQIALAFHNFHDSFNHLPALDSMGEKQPKSGLSWRVWILPFIDQAPLFNAFHQDEPWDSPHNKTLIEKMPKIYGDSPEFKTRLHVFTGEGAPFPMGTGLGFREVTDGLSNTILVVEAGEDTAEIWTKPTGLVGDPKDPLAALGKIDDQFLVAMMDGAVLSLSAKIPAAELAKCVTHADGQPVDLGPFRAELNSALAATTPVAPLVLPPLGPPTAEPDLSFVPVEACAALIVHGRRLHEHPLTQALTKDMPMPPPNPGAWNDPASMAAELQRQTDLDWRNIDTFAVFLDKRELEKPGPQRNLQSFASAYVRFAAPTRFEKLLEMYQRQPVPVEWREQDGAVGLVNQQEGMELRIISDRELLLGSVAMVPAMAQSGAGDSPLIQQLLAAGNPAVVAAIDAVPFAPVLQQAGPGLPPQAALAMPYITNAKGVTLTADLSAPTLLSLAVSFQKKELADGLTGLLGSFLDLGKQQFAQQRSQIENSEVGPLFPFLKAVVDSAALSKDNDTVAVTVPRPKNLDELPAKIQPVIAQARVAAERARKQNDLKMIGLAMHNFHDVYNHFPALDGLGDVDRPQGLSWRVHLLPFLDQAALYDQFHRDEAWDSPHNKALIGKMPAIFGENKDGKTRLHVFTGDDGSFQTGTGIGIRNITDGTSNTILVVEAGEDVAEIWTKPHGLTINPEKPLDCLGKLDVAFRALMMDGSVRTVRSTIAPEHFRAYVTPAGGEVIP